MASDALWLDWRPWLWRQVVATGDQMRRTGVWDRLSEDDRDQFRALEVAMLELTWPPPTT